MNQTNNSKPAVKTKYDVEAFFQLFVEELKQNPNLRDYYRFINDDSTYEFRKAYFIQRLSYIDQHVADKKARIWDCGSGFGTTCIFLALNGFQSIGSTLEYYHKEIPNRLKYWEQFGDMSLFKPSYVDIYDEHPNENSIDIIIVQDTLHHLEPLQKALEIFRKVLKPGGKIVVNEENGGNFILNLKHYRERGNNRIIEYYDEKLGKQVMMGNENTRNYSKWKKELKQKGFTIEEQKTEFNRILPPFFFKNRTPEKIIKLEQKIGNLLPPLKNTLFCGMNFVATNNK